MNMNNVIPIRAPTCIIPNCGRRLACSYEHDPEPIRLCPDHELPKELIPDLFGLTHHDRRLAVEQEAILHFYDRPIERRRGQRMLSLVWNFPCLQRCPLAVWDAKKFAAWAWEKCHSSGELHAARFVLSVWNPRKRWKIGKFDLMRALGTWDAGNRRAFLEWTREPWWP